MSLFQMIGLTFTLVGLFGYLNHRFIGLPDAVGITAIGLLFSLLLIGYGAYVDHSIVDWARDFLVSVDFANIVFHGALGLLLFAGGLKLNFSEFHEEKWPIITLATFGVILSTGIIGLAFYYLGKAFSFDFPLLSALLFGTIISPTDPIAALAILQKLGVPRALENKIVGESLFNDGTCVVLFLTLTGVIFGGNSASASHLLGFLALEILGGIGLGVLVGAAGFYFLKGIDSYVVEIMITLAMATGGYSLANYLQVSAPIAVVVMGLFIGSHGKRIAMSEVTRNRLFSFWELVNELLNLLLFGLIGVEMLTLVGKDVQALLIVFAIPIMITARLISVGLPITFLKWFKEFPSKTVLILTWGGLRGGISLALALSLPEFELRTSIIAATYAVVLFSILVQSLSIKPLIRRWYPKTI